MGLGCQDAFVALGTAQFDAVVEFYQRVLEQSARPLLPHRYAEFALPGLRLGIFAPSMAHTAEFARAAGAGLSLCLEVEDLEGAIAHLTVLGYPPSAPVTTASHGRELYVYDPDGNRLILHQSI